MWDILLVLFAGLLIGVCWRTPRKKECPEKAEKAEEDRVLNYQVKFLLKLVIETRWTGLTYKYLFRNRLQFHDPISAGSQLTDIPAATASTVRRRAAKSKAASSKGSSSDPPAPPLEQSPEPLTPKPKTLPAPKKAPPPPPPGWSPPPRGPPCPRCEHKMVMRRNARNGGFFWGCLRYPDCRGTRRAHDMAVPSSSEAEQL